MTEERNANKILPKKPEEKRPLRRINRRREDNKMDRDIGLWVCVGRREFCYIKM
jgi:hypothetical protein